MSVIGPIIPSPGTGNKTFTIGIAATKIRITGAGKTGNDSYFHVSQGIWITGGSQYVWNATSNSTDDFLSGKVMRLRDNSGTIIYEFSVVSTTATQVTFNFTTIPSSPPPFLLEAD